MMKKWLIMGLLIIIVLVVILVIVFVSGGSDDDGITGEQVYIPINLVGASNIGSIGITLFYDSTLLEIIDVKPGELADNAMIDYTITDPGEAKIGIIDSTGINGNGAVAVISFSMNDNKGTCSLTLNDVVIHDANTLIDIINVASDGNFDSESKSFVAPGVILVN